MSDMSDVSLNVNNRGVSLALHAHVQTINEKVLPRKKVASLSLGKKILAETHTADSDN